MRPIKFRAWDKKNKKWAWSSGHTIEVLFFSRNFTIAHGFQFDDYEWMQFTGLHDWQEKEVWEGDVLLVHNIATGDWKEVVKWDDSRGGFSPFINGGYYQQMSFCHAYRDKFEVLGNVHENPELLKP